MEKKGGDPADPKNYRPLCFEQRSQDAGHCTEDAICVALRKIEQACARRNGQIRLLALGWKRACSSMNMHSLLEALHRYGVPDFACNWLVT